MTSTLLRTIIAGVPACLLLVGASARRMKDSGPFTLLQLLGATGMMVVVFSHVCEALQLLAWMGWGREHSVGHYFDLLGAVCGLTLFPVGYLLEGVMPGKRIRQ
jgi:hypothetical protein